MQGVWKENISGWNNKDSKRKKQNRKHTLKDKVRPLVRKYHHNDIDNDSVRTECKKYYEIIEEKVKKSEETFICSAEFTYYLDRTIKPWKRSFLDEKKYFTKICYKLKNKWYDIYDNKEIICDNVKVLYKYSNIHIRYDEPFIVREGSENLKRCYYDDIVFVYNKPLPKKFYRIFGFYGTTLKKFYKKLSNSKRRANTKEWINKKDYEMDLEIKMSAVEKSYKWFID